MSSDDENQIIALATEQISKAITLTQKAIEHEDKNYYERAIIKYSEAIKVLYNTYCLLSGVVFNSTPIKTSDSNIKKNLVNFNKPYLCEKIINKIMNIYNRMVRIDNGLSSGNAEFYSLLKSINIPLDINQSSNSTELDINEVLVKVEIDENTDTFDNIIGHKFVKEKLKELSHSFTLNSNENIRNIFQSRHISSNMMIILYGEPGTGKTSLVRALANNLKIPLYELKLSSLYNKYVGESEKLMSRIFDWILLSTESKVIFIDELDSLFSKRGAGNEESLDKKLKIIFMTEMNRFNNNFHTKTLIMGATNLIEDIDEAIVRRSLLNIHVGKPSTQEEYYTLIMYEIEKLKLNVERKVIDSFIKTAYAQNISQSKINDVAKKLFSFVTAQISSDIHISHFKDNNTYFSLNGTILYPNNDKYMIITPTLNDSLEYERLYLDSDKGKELANYIILPIITFQMWETNKLALIESNMSTKQ